MVFLIALLTVVLVLDCAVLILLVLVQLPKKEAGAGLAFGGAASDALFGAGSGNVLTKITKYAATVFFALAVVLAVMQSRARKSNFEKLISGPPTATAPARMPANPATPQPAPTATPGVAPLLTASNLPPAQVEATNIPSTATAPTAPAGTNTVPPK